MEKVIQLCNTSGPNKSANGFAPLVVWERPITNPYSKCSSDIWGHVAVDSSCGYGCFLTTIDTLFVVIFSLHIHYNLKIIILFGIIFCSQMSISGGNQVGSYFWNLQGLSSSPQYVFGEFLGVFLLSTCSFFSLLLFSPAKLLRVLQKGMNLTNTLCWKLRLWNWLNWRGWNKQYNNIQF